MKTAWLHCETSFGVRQVQLHWAIRDQLSTAWADLARQVAAPNVADVLAHIAHVVNVGGIDSVGLGPDYIPGGGLGESMRFNQRVPPQFWL